MPGVELTGPEGARFVRHVLLPGWSQVRLSQATAIIAGIGALGNAVAQSLGLAGIGRLILCDPDQVEASNLARAPLFRDRHVGQPKVTAAAEILAGLAPGTQIDGRPQRLEHAVGLAELRDAAVVLGCLDSRAARLELAGRCGLVRSSWIDGATGPWDGEVRVYLDPDGPCYGCGQPPTVPSVDDRPASCALPFADSAPAGAAAPLSAVIGAHMALAAVRHIMGLPVPGGILELDGVGGTMHRIRQDRDPACGFHQPIGRSRPIAVNHHGSVGDLLAALGPGHAPLAWTPVVVSVRCPQCSFRSDQPTAADASAVCPRCASPLRRRTTLELADVDASAELAAIGIAPREILAVRTSGAIEFVELANLGG
jgi:molybdopterin/thiamine biosynthesis adenylyltransferase